MSQINSEKSSNIKSISKEILLTLACYDLGGAKKKIHTEEIAFRAFKWRAADFSWSLEKYKNYPDKEAARRPLLNARDEDQYIIGAYARDLSKDGWILTEKGIEISKKYLHLLNLKKNKSDLQSSDYKYLRKLKKSKFFIEYENELSLKEFTEYDLADLLEMRLDSVEALRDRFFRVKLMIKEFDESLYNFFSHIQSLFVKSLDENLYLEQQKVKKRSKQKKNTKLAGMFNG